MALPGMRERTVKIGSAGKIFSLTGWKVGFVVAAPALLRGARQGAPVPHLHDAAEPAGRRRLRPRQGRRLFRRHARRLAAQPRPLRRRPRRRAASACCRAEGTYFLNVDLGAVASRTTTRLLRARWCASAASRPSRSRPSTPRTRCRTVVRFCFAKRDETLDAALANLKGLIPQAAR